MRTLALRLCSVLVCFLSERLVLREGDAVPGSLREVLFFLCVCLLGSAFVASLFAGLAYLLGDVPRKGAPPFDD